MPGGMVAYEEFLAWDAPHHMAFRFNQFTQTFLAAFGEDYRVTDLGNGRCRLVWTVGMEPAGAPTLVGLILKPILTLNLRKIMRNLKKYMENVLFLDTRTRREGEVLEHTLFGIAAGVSMLFATAVLFISQSLYGTLSMPVFVALVIGYMFKDRIKELLRVYFSRAASGFLFDHKTKIYRDPQTVIGECRESFDFVDEATVPARIMKIRDRDHITEIESDWLREDVMRYRKRTKLSSKAVSDAYSEFETHGINDIMRFNIADVTQHMGDPRKELYVLDKDDYRRIKAERVYHLNMILRYGGNDQVRYKRLRIVLNRRKIKRIETVLVEDE